MADATVSESELLDLERGSAPTRHGRKYESMVVAFVDMLGAKASRRDISFLNSLAFSIETEQRLLQLWPSRTDTRFRTTWFSDNIGVSMAVGERPLATRSEAFDAVAWYVGSLQARLLSDHGISSRGGIAIGPNFHSDNMIFGPALVEAYEIESKAARFPRILLSGDLAEGADQSKVPVRSDADGGRWLDFMSIGRPDGSIEQAAYFGALRQQILNGATKAASAPTDRIATDRILAGWQWLADLHDTSSSQSGAPFNPIGRLDAPGK